MTFSSTTNRTQANGNGSTAAFAFTFKYTAKAQIEVYIDDTLQTLDTHYTLTDPSASGGTVTFETSPTDFRPQSGEVVTIRRILTEDQGTFDPTSGGGFNTASLEGMADDTVMKLQQVAERVNRAPKLKLETGSTTPTFPEPEVDKVIAWNSAGNDLENITNPSVAAAASADAAASSASDASTSEANASSSATAASDAQTAAEDAQGYAEEWAINPEDDPVSVAAGGDDSTTFSALHWAAKAAASPVTASSTTAFTNKTIDSVDNTLTLDLGEGTLTGTPAEFDAALQSDTFVFTSEVGSVAQAYAANLDGWSGEDPDDYSTTAELAEDFARRPLFGVNADADTTNRLSVTAPAVLFNRETDDFQVKVNKAAAGDTASFLFQTNFSSFAEIGLTGDDDFHFKVSPDNFSTTFEGLTIDKDNGQVTLPQRILTVNGLAAGSAQIVLGEDADNGSNTATIQAPASISSNFTLTLPEATDTLATITDVLDAGPNLQTGTSYTLALADDGQIVSMNNGSANEVTIPTNASVAFPIGATVNIVMRGAGTTTITGDTGVTVNGVSAGSGDIQNQYQGVSCYKEGTNSWVCSGDIGTVA